MLNRYFFLTIVIFLLGILLVSSCKSDKKSTAKVDQKVAVEKKEEVTKKKEKKESSKKKTARKKSSSSTTKNVTTSAPRTTTTTVPKPTSRPPTSSSAGSSQQSLLAQINRLRTNGCTCGGKRYSPVPPLRWSSKLATAARTNASQMASNKRLGHGDIGGNMKRAGYQFADAAQNISDHSTRFPEVVGNWQRSKMNCKDIMKASFKEIGIAQVNGYWAQVLATPRGGSSGSVATRPSSSGTSRPSSSGSHAGPITNLRGDMLREVNAIRSAGCTCGGVRYSPVPPLRWSSALATSSKAHATDMSRTGRLSHTGSNGSKIGTRVTQAGYNWKAVAENVSQGRPTVRAAVASWKASSSHCKNMMSKDFTEIGAAKVGEYWVQNFGDR